MINTSKLEGFMHSKGWSEPMLARALGVDYSYLYRLLRGERKGGGKVYIGILRICKHEGLDVFDFLNIK
ncbi:MAG: helix-turn-helix transcriptional regulator [Halanaerobiales bacterium]|nr:helix-turn-helix transcriptional regulator [Halanaerobiales bacterium]